MRNGKKWLDKIGRVIIIALLFAVGVFLIWTGASHWAVLPNAMVAAGTILLALATFELVRTGREENITFVNENKLMREGNRERENRDRKERYFNEIIDWLTGLETRLLLYPTTTIRDRVSGQGLRLQMGIDNLIWESLDLREQTLKQFVILRAEIAKGEYLQKLAQLLNDDNLASLIKDVTANLKTRKDISSEWWAAEAKTNEDIALSELVRLTVDKFGKNINEISQLVSLTLEKAVEAKVNLLQN